MAVTKSGNLYLIRHGETEWSRAGRHTGLTDLDLTEDGVNEARSLGATFAEHEFAEIRVSPLQRAKRTAELAGLSPATIEPDLVEWDYGGYEGMTTLGIQERLDMDWSVWTDGVIPGETPGETVWEVGARVDAVIESVAPALATGDVALIAHAHSLRILAARWLGLEPAAGSLLRLETASFAVLGLEHGRHVIHRWSVR